MEKIKQNESDIVSQLLALAEKKGDLPIFSASLNNVRRISSDPEADAMELAQTVMKDSNLSTKLLKVANSPYYSRSITKISSVSRAVVLLGFDVIKSLCLTLKLIENFQDEHPTVAMHKMVSRSYLTAGFVRDIALMSKMKNAEETYVSGLCHNIGEIAVGYFLPEKFAMIHAAQKENKLTWQKAQQQVLGQTFAEIAQELGQAWNFSDKVVKSMSAYRANHDGPARNIYELNHAVVALSSQIVDAVYLDDSASNQSMRDLFLKLEESTGIKVARLEKSLSESFARSCELIKSYGLSPDILKPNLSESNDSLRDQFSRDFSFLASSEAELAAKKEAVEVKTEQKPSNEKNVTPTAINTVTESSPSDSPKGDPMVQLSYIQEITTLVTESAPLSALFSKILLGLQEGVGFDRAALSLVTPDRSQYATRLAVGDNNGFLKKTLRGKTQSQHDIFARIIDEGGDLLIDNVRDGSWDKLIPSPFINGLQSNSFIIAGVKHGAKPIGLFYADNELTQGEISPAMRRGFFQFIAQSRLAVQIVN